VPKPVINKAISAASRLPAFVCADKAGLVRGFGTVAICNVFILIIEAEVCLKRECPFGKDFKKSFSNDIKVATSICPIYYNYVSNTLFILI
jgi:hypothetical protein